MIFIWVRNKTACGYSRHIHKQLFTIDTIIRLIKAPYQEYNVAQKTIRVANNNYSARSQLQHG